MENLILETLKKGDGNTYEEPASAQHVAVNDEIFDKIIKLVEKKFKSATINYLDVDEDKVKYDDTKCEEIYTNVILSKDDIWDAHVSESKYKLFIDMMGMDDADYWTVTGELN
jgi:hypothetical protein